MAFSDVRSGASLRQRIGLVLGPVVFGLALVLPAPAGLSPDGWLTAGLAGLMAVWWITEAIPIPATALLPLVVLPVAGVGTMRETAAPYANPIIFLFLGGFILAAGLEASGLHRRLALGIIRLAGTTPRRLIAGFMAATAFLSMWISNTATVMMMLPIAVTTLAVVERDSESPDPHLPIALLLGVAYAANIGGLATLIGTPPNALLAGFMEETYGVTVGFAQWMTLGLPLTLVALPLCWLLLSRLLFPVGNGETTGGDHLTAEWRARGAMSRPERVVAVVTGGTALAWMFRPVLSKWVPGLSDPGIAIAGALLLFLIPVDWKRLQPVLRWKSVERLPWGILILFGGGISLASAIQRSGLAEWIGAGLGAVGAWPLIGMVAAVTAVIVLLTEITSNTATAATFLPVVAALAVASGLDPLVLAAPAALAASCAFMLPVATPPNAIVYASERVPIIAMIRAGLVLNVMMVVLITVMSLGILRLWGSTP
jgi:sodium-dependent dicarboxylate transporter 2/3/5